MKFNKIKFALWAVLAAAAAAFVYHFSPALSLLTAGLGGKGLCLAATPIIVPKGSKDLDGIRGFFASLKTQFASTATVFEGPLRQLFDEVTGKLEAALAALPKTTTTEASAFTDQQVESFFNLLASAQQVVATLGSEFSQTKQQMASMVVLDDAIAKGLVIKPINVEELLTQRLAERTGEKGDLITKELSQQLCSAAKEVGLAEGRAARDAELKAAAEAATLAETRTTALTTAGLPLPEATVAAVLRAAEPDFTAAKTMAEARLKKLTEAGLDLPAELLGKVWAAEGDYKNFESTVLAIPALKRAARKDEPLATPLPGAGGNVRMIL